MVLKVFYCGLRARVNVEFAVDVAEVPADGFQANAEGVGDFLAEIAFGQLLQDLALAVGEVLNFVPSGYRVWAAR